VSAPASLGAPRSLELAGNRVLLTGGVGALGIAIAATLATHNADVVLVDRLTDDEAHALVGDALWPHVEYHRCDVTDAAAVAELFDRLEDRALDVVCPHAGIVRSDPVEAFPADAFEDVLTVNVRGAFLVARAAAARWRRRAEPGHLIFTSSWVHSVPWPGITPYAASKAAVTALARGFARELAPFGIRANVVAPGIVAAGMAKRQWDTDPDYRRRASRAIPLGVLQEPQSVADAFLFLCSQLASYLTGATLLVDGGASLYPLD
jgi:NAD(P)-dependent dehydrogenase (short-subunit alcohol dehydrogenase family)